MDEWGELLFEASYFGTLIDIVSTDDDFSRALVEHKFPFRDGAVLSDMGAEPRSTSVRVVFIPTSDQELDHITRLIEFLNLLDDASSITPTPQFVHPIVGSYPALPRDISMSASAQDRDIISVSLTFVEDGLDPAAFESPGDQSISTGVAAVELARDDTNASLNALVPDLDPPVTVQDSAVTAAEGWRDDPGVTPRQVNLELNRITNKINDESDRLQVATRVDRYPIFLSFQRLHSAIRDSADLAIATGPSLLEHIVQRTEPLVSIMTQIFGGTVAIDQYNRTRELNDIDNPARIEAGTTLIIEQP